MMRNLVLVLVLILMQPVMGRAQDRPVVLETTPRFFLLAQDDGGAAQAALAPMIGSAEEVEAVRLPLWNDRVLLAASVFDGAAFGISGLNFAVYTQTGTAPVRQVMSVTGAVGWADLDNLTDGWPDIWLQNVRGLNQPFGIWRWDGQAYAHLKNVPAQ